MKTIAVTLPSKGSVRIIPFADLHIGSAKCDYKLIKDQIEKVASNEDTYAVIVGDLINNSTKNSVGDVFTEKLSPMEQIEMACELFEPIKDKILAVTAGNHERRSYKYDGVDLIAYFAMKLGIESRYDYCAPFLVVNTGYCRCHKVKCCNAKTSKITYTMYIVHGDGANGRLVGGKANSLERRANIVPNADVVITGHTHQPLSFKESCFLYNSHRGVVEEHETTFVNCASTLGYEGYAELFGMRPSSIAQPEIILGGNKKEVKVIL